MTHLQLENVFCVLLSTLKNGFFVFLSTYKMYFLNTLKMNFVSFLAVCPFLESFKGQRMRFFVSLFLKCSAPDLSSFNEILRWCLWVINCGYHFLFIFVSKAQYIGHWSRLSRHEIALIESERFFSERKKAFIVGKSFLNLTKY